MRCSASLLDSPCARCGGRSSRPETTVAIMYRKAVARRPDRRIKERLTEHAPKGSCRGRAGRTTRRSARAEWRRAHGHEPYPQRIRQRQPQDPSMAQRAGSGGRPPTTRCGVSTLTGRRCSASPAPWAWPVPPCTNTRPPTPLLRVPTLCVGRHDLAREQEVQSLEGFRRFG